MVMDEAAKAYLASLDEGKKTAFEDRRCNASIEDISSLAQQMWDDPELGPMFRRLGVEGDMEYPGSIEFVSHNPDKPWLAEPTIEGATEWHKCCQFIDRFRSGARWGVRWLDLWLATGLCRQRADGLIKDFSPSEITPFIEDRRGLVSDGSNGYSAKPHGVDVIVDMAKAMAADPEFVHFLKTRPEKIDGPEHDRQINIVRQFKNKYQYKYCLFNRRFSGVTDLTYFYISKYNKEEKEILEDIIRFNSNVSSYMKGER